MPSPGYRNAFDASWLHGKSSEVYGQSLDADRKAQKLDLLLIGLNV